MYVSCLVRGVPYAKVKSRGKVQAPKEWSDQIVRQTRELPRVTEACILKVTFLLPPDKFPRDFPFGPDLDNLLKRLLDALNDTVFSGSRGGDSCVVAMYVSKVKVESDAEAGAHLEILPVDVE